MAETSLQKDVMDVLQRWVDQFNARAGGAIALSSGGEAGGAQLRLKYNPTGDTISILHFVAVIREGRPAILVSRFEGPTAETSVEAGLWASGQLGRRPGATR
ncbi:MAG TPA: hypothetical protein VGQ29_08985 [Gemmatimonadales bacterium]|jgi:hypothetical protein|nr:hypothetical protein [Gemmatimonadales bacterium]